MTASYLPPVRPSVDQLEEDVDPALEAAHDAQAAVAAVGTPLSALATTEEEDDGEDALETLDARVVLEDGTSWTVAILNRDFVAWDLTRGKKKWPQAEEAPFILNNFLAWTASKRAGHDVGTFEAFVNRANVVKVRRGEAARPTR